MDRFRIRGPVRLAGTIRASGAKNAALPALAASLLTDEPVTLRRVPRVQDIHTMGKLLEYLDVGSEVTDDGVILRPERRSHPDEAPYELVKTMRAGALVLGPLVARRGHARVSLPGGCAIGVRPIDHHLAGLEAMGAEVELEHGYVEARCPLSRGRRLRGTRFRFPQPTVGGTENLMMAATLAHGTTVLENCAREPEIVDLARLLTAMGAAIDGAGDERIVIEGRDHLGSATHAILPDRIEAGTYLIGAAITRGDVTVEACRPADLAPLLEKLDEIGAVVEVSDDRVRVSCDGGVRPADVATAPHPGFPTDLQAQYMALMTRAQGVSTITETVFENRFQHVPELVRMGADILIEKSSRARVQGPRPLSGAAVMATDLRASACLVLAALAADGETVVQRIYHLDRGYEGMESKLQTLGARVERLRD